MKFKIVLARTFGVICHVSVRPLMIGVAWTLWEDGETMDTEVVPRENPVGNVTSTLLWSGTNAPLGTVN